MHRSFATALILSAGAAGAQPVDGVVEIGGLTPIAADAYGRAVSVVTAEEIAQRQITHVADALRTLPGLAVSRQGTVGGLTQVRLRGAEASHTKVLIDGIEAAGPETGFFDFSTLLAADIARIEVLRGPQSSLFGANAIGGVVSITTNRAALGAGGASASAAAEFGEDGSAGANLALRSGGERVALGFSAASRYSQGFDISGDGGEEDDSRNATLRLGTVVELTPTTRLTFSVTHVERRAETDGSSSLAPVTGDSVIFDTDANFIETEDTLATIGVVQQVLGGRGEVELRFDTAWFDTISAYSFEDPFTSRDSVFVDDTSGERHSGLLRVTLALDAPYLAAANHTLNLALDHDEERFRFDDPETAVEPGQLEEKVRRTTGAVVEYRGAFDYGVDVQAGLRHDDNDGFSDKTTASVGLSWELVPKTTRLHASAGTGVQNPTLIDQFGFLPGFFTGNPNLKPEESRGYDIGVEHRFATGIVDVTYFRQVLTNEIVLTPAFDSVVNEDGESDRQGVELAARFDLTSALAFAVNYTWLDATDPDGRREVRRPRHSLGLGFDWTPDDRTVLTLGVQHLAGLEDAFFDGARTARVELGDHTLVDVAARRQLTDTLDLTARVSNLFDAEHEEVYGYDSEGRTAYVGLAARF